MYAARIESPDDLARMLEAESHSVENWVSAIRPTDTKVRRAVSAIFNNLPYVDVQEPDLVSSFLDTLEEPMNDLAEQKVQIFAILAKGKYTAAAPSGKPAKPVGNWHHVQYIVAPDPAFFFVKDEAKSHQAHLLTPGCSDGLLAVTTRQEKSLVVFPSMDLMCKYFENNIPWCPSCCLLAAKDQQPPCDD